MTPKVNDIVRLEIVDITLEGDGVGKLDSYTIFVKGGIIGDILDTKLIKVNKKYGIGIVHQLVKSSQHRVEPRCEAYKKCGGCTIQNLDYNQQIITKSKMLRDNLNRIGGFADEILDRVIDDPVSMHTLGLEEYRFRNKSQYPVGYDADAKVIAGYYAPRSHRIINISDCKIGIEENGEIISRVLSYMNKNNIKAYEEVNHKGLIRHIAIRKAFATGEIMVTIVINGKELQKKDELIERLKEVKGVSSIVVNYNLCDTNVIMGHNSSVIWGNDTIRDIIGDINYDISATSFYQVNPAQTHMMYKQILEYAALKGDEIVWDVYCGIGTITLFLAKYAKHIFGVEEVQVAIDNARSNARINNINNVTFYCGKAEELIPVKGLEHGKVDVVVLDPPRKGCLHEVIDTLIQSKIDKIIYMSCNPSTLARDLKMLCDDAYDIKKIRMFDVFCHSGHCEVVCLLHRKDSI